MRLNKKILGFLVLIVSLFLLAGCGGSSSPKKSGTVPVQHIGSMATELFLTFIFSLNMPQHYGSLDAIIPAHEDAWKSAWYDLWNKLIPNFRYPFNMYKIYYDITRPDGTVQHLSGLLVVPTSVVGIKINVPIISLQHPTQVERDYSPSNGNVLDNELTVPFAMALASMGYITVVADYPGMGINNDVHPYCLETIADSIIAMIRAAKDSKESWLPSDQNTSWNGRLYLIGYSEGGYATMVTAKHLQKKGEFAVSAVAALDGPYSLSDTMRNLMIDADATYSSPYFLPYTIAGYNDIYKGNTDVFNFYKAVKGQVPSYTPPKDMTYAEQLYSMLDGSFSGNQISVLMQKATPYIGPKSILTDQFYNALKDTDRNAPIYQRLLLNDGFYAWTPSMPLKMFHNSLDDLVPVGNMDAAVAAWKDVPNVYHEHFTEYNEGLGSVHAGSLPIAYYKGFMWIDSYAYPDRH
jgi:pimeloyl-ACP methyl ester carboxylesterase